MFGHVYRRLSQSWEAKPELIFFPTASAFFREDGPTVLGCPENRPYAEPKPEIRAREVISLGSKVGPP